MTRYNLAKHRNHVISGLPLTAEQYQQELHDWRIQFPSSTEADLVWSLYNRWLSNIVATETNEFNRYGRLRTVYGHMSFFLKDEGKPDNCLEQFHVNSIRQYDAASFEVEIHLHTDGCCPECAKLAVGPMSVEDALAFQTLPHAGCTNIAGCLCIYTGTGKRGANGKLIKKKK